MAAMRSWRKILEGSFTEMDHFLRHSNWRGRENEAVNLFVHRFLANRVSPDGPLRSLRQVGIEVAVNQVAPGLKRYVRKDLVIWPEEDMTVWTGDGVPSVIVEWKRGLPENCEGDAEWLAKFCSRYSETLGYTACVSLTQTRGCRHFLVEPRRQQGLSRRSPAA
jgi:hypothetical protein